MATTAAADADPPADAGASWLSEHHAPATASPNPAPLAAASPAGATPSTAPEWFRDFLTGAPPGHDGPAVNEHTALNYAALYSCVSLIAGTISSLPLKVYRRREDGGQDEAPDAPEYDRLQVEFNPNTSAMSGREATLGHLLTWGNSYAQVVRNRLPSRDVIRLQPIGPDIVDPRMNNSGELVYDVYDRETGNVADTLRRDEVLHVPGISFDGMQGYSTVRIARSVLRAGMAQDREAERFITRGIRPPGAVKFPPGKKFADEKQAIKYRDTFRRLHSQEEGSLNVLILEDGADWMQLGVDPVSAQLLESRAFSIQEVCSIYHVPPHMVGSVSKVTSWGSGIEEMTIGFVVYALLPILRRVEQEYNRKLFARDRTLFCEHVLSGLLRGDTLKQAQAIQIYMQWGLLTVNEARRLLGWNPIPGGNVRYYPLNMGRVDDQGRDVPAMPAPDGAAGGGQLAAAKLPSEATLAAGLPPSHSEAEAARPADRDKLAAGLRRAIVAGAGRCLRKEAEAARRAANKPAEFGAWADGFYSKHGEMVAEALRPLLEAWAAAFPFQAGDASGWAESAAALHCTRSRHELLVASECKPDELPEAVERLAARWQGERLAELAAEFQTPTG